MRIPICLLVAVAIAFLSPGCSQGGSRSESKPYLERRAAFKTTLTKRAPAPQPYQDEALPPNVREVRYPSGDLSLRGWVHVPPQAETTPLPVLVFFHGGFAFGLGDDLTYSCAPFIDAGFVVFCPALRGENGNPGHFEFFFGEIDDAANAVRWIAAQPYADEKNVFVFGHSAGGLVASLLTLMDDIPMRHSGSCGGLYDATLANDMGRNDRAEYDLRFLVGNLRWMNVKHYAFVGSQDYGCRSAVDRLKAERDRLRKTDSAAAPLILKVATGDHGTSLAPSMKAYLAMIEKELPEEVRENMGR